MLKSRPWKVGCAPARSKSDGQAAPITPQTRGPDQLLWQNSDVMCRHTQGARSTRDAPPCGRAVRPFSDSSPTRCCGTSTALPRLLLLLARRGRLAGAAAAAAGHQVAERRVGQPARHGALDARSARTASAQQALRSRVVAERATRHLTLVRVTWQADTLQGASLRRAQRLQFKRANLRPCARDAASCSGRLEECQASRSKHAVKLCDALRGDGGAQGAAQHGGPAAAPAARAERAGRVAAARGARGECAT